MQQCSRAACSGGSSKWRRGSKTSRLLAWSGDHSRPLQQPVLQQQPVLRLPILPTPKTGSQASGLGCGQQRVFVQDAQGPNAGRQACAALARWIAPKIPRAPEPDHGVQLVPGV